MLADNLFGFSDNLWLGIWVVVALCLKELFDRKRYAALVAKTAGARVDDKAIADLVKQTLRESVAANAERLDEIIKTTRMTEALCNSAMAAQLLLVAKTARAKADLTKDLVDVMAANLAEANLAQHDWRQVSADAQGKKEDARAAVRKEIQDRPAGPPEPLS